MPIELRSDTFTTPTPGMLEAMVSAELGDDMAGEDPSVNRLEAQIASMLGMEAAVFACSGTQSNQMGLWANCERGDEVLIESTGHIANYESGAPALISGVSIRRITGSGGRLNVENLDGHVRHTDVHFSPTKLLCLENSTNLGGGLTYPLEQLESVCRWAHQNGLRTHLDGARVFNACVARGYGIKDVARHFDTVSICFSKGLGCPMGSILVGSADLIRRARRCRKVMGGALRQAGIVAAAASYAIENHIERLAEDHTHALQLAKGLASIPKISINIETVETNLVFFEIDPSLGTAAEFAQRLKANGINLYPAGGPQRLRACTHLGVSQDEVQQAVSTVKSLVN